MATAMDVGDWQSLLSQTQDLVAQDYHNFPRVDRNFQQLQQYAESLRARTNKFRTLDNQIKATRLLAQQGFDATRLTQDVTTLDIQPTIEDVFHADTTSVEDYLKQVEESTILAAIQEAQQESNSSFEAYMEECMAHDWAANRRQLLTTIAPHVGGPVGGGFGAGAGMGGAAGMMPLIGSTPSRGGAAGGAGGAGLASLRLPPLESAYVEVVQRASQATATGSAGFDLVREFRDACKGREDKAGAGETNVSSCWALLADIVGEAKARGVAPQGASPRFIEALLTGARKHLEKGHTVHMRNTLQRHKLQAERGADPEQIREVQAFVQVKLAGKGLLDFQQPGGHDTSWVQVFYCLRNGWVDAARRAAERTHDLLLPSRLLPGAEHSFKSVLDEWARGGGRLPDRLAGQLAKECERLMRDKAALKSQIKYPYMVLVCALLAGDARAADALTATLAQLQLPSVLSTIEDYMWCKLMLATANAAGSAAAQPSSPLLGGYSLSAAATASPLAPYTLAELHADLNRWPSSYYSKQGKEPLLYVTVLLLSLQFQSALRFMWRDDSTKAYRVDAVHMAIAMHQEQLLALPAAPAGGTAAAAAAAAAAGGEAGLDVGSLIHSYGRKFVTADSSVALHYYMLAAAVRGGSLAVKGQMLRELLTESRDFGTLLGGGGALAGAGGGAGGALGAYVPDAQERKRLFEAVAYECQVAAQPEEAVELYMAADRPRQALALINGQLSGVIEAAVEEAATGVATSGAGDTLRRLMIRGRDARERIGPGADAGSRREVEAFDQLTTVWEMLLAARKGRSDLALQKLCELSFIPLERSRVEGCARWAESQLHPAVQERLQDVLAAAAGAISAQKAGASRDKLHTLKTELDALCMFANSVSLRVPRTVYQKLCEAAAGFS